MGSLIFKACIYKDHWCDGKHIPMIKVTRRITVKGYPEYSDIDINKTRDKEPCQFYIDGKCNNPEKPKRKSCV